MSVLEQKKTAETRQVEGLLKPHFAEVEAYRQNSASIRVRIIDSRFRGKSRTDREAMVLPLLEKLPEATQGDITVLLLLAPEERSSSMMNVEFEDPVQSSL